MPAAGETVRAPPRPPISMLIASGTSGAPGQALSQPGGDQRPHIRGDGAAGRGEGGPDQAAAGRHPAPQLVAMRWLLGQSARLSAAMPAGH